MQESVIIMILVVLPLLTSSSADTDTDTVSSNRSSRQLPYNFQPFENFARNFNLNSPSNTFCKTPVEK